MNQEFLYQVPWLSRDRAGGHHHSASVGTGMAFHSHVPLTDYPDVRHLDLHASLRDPYAQYQVRRQRQESQLNVVVIADLSPSLYCFGKYLQLLEIVQSTAWSVTRNGDLFSFIGAGATLVNEVLTPPTRRYNRLDALWAALAQYRPKEAGSHGLLNVAQWLPRKRCLIFLLSDYYLPTDTLNRLFKNLDAHDVVPIVLIHEQEYRNLPNWRFLRLSEPETGSSKNYLMRPRLRAEIEQRFLAHRARIKACCQYLGRAPIFIDNDYRSEDITNYFMGVT